MKQGKQKAIIIGAGPAGLTAAYELLKRTNIIPIVIEKSNVFGGISQTFEFHGNRLDLGGHRFFTKSDRVMDWWLKFLPLESAHNHLHLSYQGQTKKLSPSKTHSLNHQDHVMMVRNRLSRIYYNRQFFDYPLKLSLKTIKKLGYLKTAKVGFTYLQSKIFPLHPENNLEEFYINQFGKELYQTFFKTYTEKLWGNKCQELSAEWGRQRTKGLSLSQALLDPIKKLFIKEDIKQKETNTSLIERFLYPKYGPGQMWDLVAAQVKQLGGTIIKSSEVVGLNTSHAKIIQVIIKNHKTKTTKTLTSDWVFSSMPVKDLFTSLHPRPPLSLRNIAKNLQYRDFIIIGLEIEKKYLKTELKDNWVYIHEPNVRALRMQIVNNWSPYMVKTPDQSIVLGMEYFCDQKSALWKKSKKQLVSMAVSDLKQMRIFSRVKLKSSGVVKMPKTYPVYSGAYNNFTHLKQYTDQIENLFLIGRNGMHRYNNQDHSMLTAMTAVDNIKKGIKDKSNIWQVNTEQEYHERKQT